MSQEVQSGSRVFVGREMEFAMLAEAFEAAVSGRGSLTTVTGPPGIGKSALVDEHLKAVHDRGVLAVRGRCLEGDGIPYGPWLQILQRLARAGFPPASSQLRRWLAGNHDAIAERAQLFDLIATHLLKVANSGGLVLVVEDAQWADASSLLLFIQLLDDLANSRLQAIATCHSELDREDTSSLIQRMTREPSCRQIVLQNLSTEETRQYLRLRLAGRAPAPDESRFLQLTGGHPLFMSETAAVLVAGGTLDQVPASVHDLVRQRISKLPPAVGALLKAAAVIGTELDLSLLASVLDVPAQSLTETVDQATDAGLLAVSPARPDRLRFVHEMFRAAIYGDLAPSQRRAQHRLTAEAIEALYDQRPNAAEHLAELSYHWLRSGGDPSKAAQWTEAAADHAVERTAYEEAIRHYEIALPITGESDGDLLLKLARAQYLAGQITPAFTTVQKLVEVARAANRPQLMAEAALVLEGVGDPGMSAQLADLCRDVLDQLGPTTPAVTARVLGQLTTQLGYLDFEKTAEASARAMALADESGDPDALIAALRARQMACSGPDGAEERVLLAQRMIELGSATRRPQVVFWGRLWRIDALLQLGDFIGVDSEQVQLTTLVDQLQLPLGRWHRARIDAARAAFAGQFQQAQAAASVARELGRRGGHAVAELQWSAFQILLAWYTGDHSSLEELAQHRGSGFMLPVNKAGGAMLMLMLGREAEARLLFQAGVTQFATHPLDHQWLSAAAGLADLSCAFSEIEPAAVLYSRLTPFANRLAVPGAGPPIVIGGAMCLHLGRLARLLGKADAAAYLQQAIEVHERLGSPPFAALAKFEYARHLAAAGHPRDAAQLAQTVLGTAQQLGMKPLATQASELVSTLTKELAAGPLTRREAEIAELVAKGMTNKQIAAQIHLSERTVETHVQNILGKLGFRTRSQIAAWAAQSPPDC